MEDALVPAATESAKRPPRARACGVKPSSTSRNRRVELVPGRRRGSAKALRAWESGAECTGRASTRKPRRSAAASGSAHTTIPRSTPASSAAAFAKTARAAAECGVARPTPKPRRCAAAACSATTTACAAPGTRASVHGAASPARASTRTPSRCVEARSTAHTTAFRTLQRSPTAMQAVTP